MYLVYLYTFKDKEEVFIGLSDDLNFHLEWEKKYFDIIKLEINSIDIVYFSLNKKKALEEKAYWLAKTKNLNNSLDLKQIPNEFITNSLKKKNEIKENLQKLESDYMTLFFKYETLEENYYNLQDIVDKAIEDEINNWKDSK